MSIAAEMNAMTAVASQPTNLRSPLICCAPITLELSDMIIVAAMMHGSEVRGSSDLPVSLEVRPFSAA